MMTEDVVRRTGRLLQRLLGAAPVNASGEPAEGRWFRPSPLASVTLCVLWSVMGSIRADTVGITTVPAEVFGLQGDGHSGLSRARSISEDGCCVTFSSDATNLVAGDTNGKTDVFVHNSCSNPPVTMRVSLNNVGIQGNNRSY